MLKKRWVKIGLIILVVVTLISANTDVFGAINVDYYDAIKEDLKVIEGSLDSKVKGSVLLDAVSILVYAVGSLLEWVLGLLFQGVSGGNQIFPWADAILFNAVPLLDINIFNPSGASLVGIMQEFIAQAYWTVFSLALSFLGIAIMVSAIKLVVSTIATEKATYKQAIMKYLMGFVMLWGIHFFMSFMLYLNESLVETASKMAQQSVTNATVDLASLRETTESDYEILQSFCLAMTDGNWDVATMVGTGLLILVVVVVVVAVVVASGGTAGAAGAVGAAGAAGGTAGAAGATVGAGAIGATAAVGAGGLTGWAAFSAGVAKAGAAVLTAIKVTMTSAAILGAGGLGGYLVSQGIDSLTENEFITMQAGAIEGIRGNIITQFKSGAIISSFSEEMQAEFSGCSGQEITMKYLFTKDVASVAARLLRNENYIYSIQARVKGELRADSEKLSWKSYNDEDVIYGLAADTFLIMNDMLSFDEYNNDQISYQTLLKNYVTSINAIDVSNRVIRKVDTSNWKTTIISYAPGVEAEEENVNYDQILEWYCDGMTYVRDDYLNRKNGSSGNTENSNVISTLAKAFKEMAWTNSGTSWKPSKPVIQGALMYAILVAQSLIFFIAYAKRLFYVIILILVAPVVVVYDFFTKF